ncbi:hypothetical protein VFPPC_04944 [Pochonia chlamydosporia 170]|uniref:Uncharacterized protein n=1 Tax=Pochonia chlamydosporia 170 TaxID=1380566 RepID=A0A179FT38_METCM|nr:hypothetical protein VFPPC_04944 [Pochonia chlamydosporia 170]OAQ68754.1 hypothetical protein VFPPC_04944 [Pochonia chlamydosporia 170]
MASDSEQQQWFLRTSYPVDFPSHDALTKSRAEFEAFLTQELKSRHGDTEMAGAGPGGNIESDVDKSDTFTLVSDPTISELRKNVEGIDMASTEDGSQADTEVEHGESTNMPNMENKMFTENKDVTYRTTTESLVDLFSELEDTITGPRLRDALEAAWKDDPLITLKIIFNARSIHLGKSSRSTFYRAAGWLAQNHPLTLIANLEWLCRPVIEKKARKDGDGDLVIVDAEKPTDDRTAFDVNNGVSHGYWKDLLNMLALAANNKLDVLSNPHDVLNVEDKIVRTAMITRRLRRQEGPTGRVVPQASRGSRLRIKRRYTPRVADRVYPTGQSDTKEKAKQTKHKIRDDRHQAAVDTFKNNSVYRALHLTVARLFAEQLQADLAAFGNSDAKMRNSVSLCGKWAPSHAGFHDKHTFVTSSIAEILYPQRDFADKEVRSADRDTYLRHARERYRKDMSALRKHLTVVERDITAGTFENIKYERVPSLAMNNYTGLFAKKDMGRFEKYLTLVAEGKANISGATLLPSTLILKAEQASRYVRGNDDKITEDWIKSHSATELMQRKIAQVEAKVIDGQWNTLVKRLKDSGTLSSSIAVCDVSGSMSSPTFKDKTTPMHSAIGLSLLIAEIAAPPFGASFITFSAQPSIEKVDLSSTLTQKYIAMSDSSWGMNTNFVAVFEDILLPLAREHSLKPEDMVKRVFVFSDMQFDTAQSGYYGSEIPSWSSSFERVSALFKEEGYEMPELVFWNLAGGGRGESSGPKAVTASDEGTCLVSGYSQGMLKVFLENGSFGDEEGEGDEVLVTKEEDGETITAEPVKKKARIDPMAVVRKAVGHKAYDMLRVLD